MTKLTQTNLARNAIVAFDTLNSERRSVRAALSSEAPVQRVFGVEVLRHSNEAIDLSRANDNGLPLLVNHDHEALPIGRVRNITLDADSVLRGDLEFSEATQAGRDAWALAQEGTLSDVSVSYRINKYETRGKGKSEQIIATDWSVYEASVVSVPADASVGIGRQMEIELEAPTMPDEKTAPEVPAQPPLPSASRIAGRDEGVMLERKRISDIGALAANFRTNPVIADLATRAIDDGYSVESFKDAMLQELAGEPAEPLAKPVEARTIEGGATSGEKYQRAVVEALELRCNVFEGDERKAHAQNEFSGYSIVELGRRWLEMGNVPTRGMTPTDIAGALLTRYIDPGTVPASGVSTYFPDILENIFNKSLFQGFMEAPTTYQLWTGNGTSRDFKPGTVPGLSHFTSLTKGVGAGHSDGEAITDGVFEDKKEGFQVDTFAKKFSLTRKSMVDDDLGAFADVTRKLGMAAARTVDEQVYAFLEANGNMTEDSNPLFDATSRTGDQANLVTGAGDPSTANISTARTLMGKKVDWNNVLLGIAPQYMLVPLELERIMLELQSVITGLDPDATSQMRDNVYRTMWQPVASPRLTDANDWYMFGARGEHINVVWLNGVRSPSMARDEGWSVLGAHWRVFIDFDVMAVDWRSAIKFSNV